MLNIVKVSIGTFGWCCLGDAISAMPFWRRHLVRKENLVDGKLALRLDRPNVPSPKHPSPQCLSPKQHRLNGISQTALPKHHKPEKVGLFIIIISDTPACNLNWRNCVCIVLCVITFQREGCRYPSSNIAAVTGGIVLKL